MKSWARTWVVLAALCAGSALAEPLPRERVPAPLQPWVDWVLRGHEDAECPMLDGGGDARRCAWPAALTLDLGASAGEFTQAARLYREAWVTLPGDAVRWPQDVRVDGKPAVVVPYGGLPAIRLGKGAHQITGSFAWDQLPEVLAIPAETALLRLVLDGAEVAFPRREPPGQLWLKSRAAAVNEEARLEVHVDRRVIDDIPLELVTRIELRVSGKGREALLATALPEGFVPMSLASALPARVEPDGRIRVQVRPGVHVLELHARHDGPVKSLALAAADGPWAAEEVWVFEARNDLRLVSVEGVPAVDPQQTQLPPAWRSLPAYVMRPGSTMRLAEQRRGDADPAPDQLTLQRSWWLDFDGRGYTVSDQIGGTLGKSWRLDMAAPMVLGRVAIDGRDQLITRGPGDAAGVEIRQGTVRMQADSRVPRASARVPAVGWSEDFHQMSGQLHLPPGWRLLHASGVDDVSSTWIAQWTLLDLFLVLIIALAAVRIWGRAAGMLALATVALTYHEAGAPHGLWLALLAAEALIPLLPAGRVLATARTYRFAVLIALVVVVVPFAIRQLRVGMYPALEAPDVGVGLFDSVSVLSAATEAMPQAAPPPPMPAEAPRVLRRKGGLAGSLAENEAGEADAIRGGAAPVPQRERALRYLDDKAMVSTGPGLPRWQWQTVGLGWRGPVERGQDVRFVLLSPFVNLLLAFLRVGLLAALLLRGLGLELRIPPRFARGGVAAAVLAALACGAAGPAAAADYPPADMLNELRERLLAHPECFPTCASSARLRIEAGAAGLVLRIEIDAAADSAVPLPGGARSWSPAKVIVDGAPAEALARDGDGTLWLALDAGRHQVVLEGALPAIDTIDLPLPLRPHRVEAQLAGFALEGVREDGAPEDSVRLVRERKSESREPVLEPGELPPFARVVRELRLGLVWEVETALTRLSPAGTALTAEIPLLPGESVTSANVRVENGKAIVVLSPGASEIRWRSVLKEAPTIALAAPTGAPWADVWRVDASPLWHVEPTGIPPVHTAPGGGDRVREWRPWPGETVSLAITRPEGFPGQTTTIDHTVLDVSPGLRSTDASLSVEMRSSRGGQHVFTLPEDAALQSVAIDGAPQPVRQENRSVTVPIVPGAQTITLAWRSSHGVAARITSPPLATGIASVNAETIIHMPADRWTLAVGGGRLGPAVLFWSFLVVLLIAALALARVPLTPLGAAQWFLLGLGLTQASIWVALIVAGWLLALGWRRARGAEITSRRFDLLQILLALWTLAALSGLFASIQQGLLGTPDMQIAGNGSSAALLRWYHDHAASELPRAWVISVPLLAYRLSMLAWALWIAWALLAWLRWGWDAYSAGGLWRPWRKAPIRPPAIEPPPVGAN